MAKLTAADRTGADFAQVGEAVDAGGVTVGKVDLNGVTADGSSGVGFHTRLVHRQKVGFDSFHFVLSFLLAFVVTGCTGAMVAEVGKIVAAGVPVRPGDLDTLASRHANFHIDRFLARVERQRHKFILSERAQPQSSMRLVALSFREARKAYWEREQDPLRRSRLALRRPILEMLFRHRS